MTYKYLTPTYVDFLLEEQLVEKIEVLKLPRNDAVRSVPPGQVLPMSGDPSPYALALSFDDFWYLRQEQENGDFSWDRVDIVMKKGLLKYYM